MKANNKEILALTPLHKLQKICKKPAEKLFGWISFQVWKKCYFEYRVKSSSLLEKLINLLKLKQVT